MSHSEPPLVDSHFHLYEVKAPLAPEAWMRPPEDAGIERFEEVMTSNGVLFGVIAAASLHGNYNDYVRNALRRSRRFRATAIVDPSIDVYQLERMKAEGFVGIRLVWRDKKHLPDIDSPEYRLLLRRVADLDWHVHVYEYPHRMTKLIAAIERAGAKVVIDHMANPEPGPGLADEGFKAVLSALERGRTWVKLSAGFRSSSPELAAACAAQLVRATGGERLVWGSDWPFAGYEKQVTYEETLATLERWVPDAAIRRRITGRTPLELYFT